MKMHAFRGICRGWTGTMSKRVDMEDNAIAGTSSYRELDHDSGAKDRVDKFGFGKH